MADADDGGGDKDPTEGSSEASSSSSSPPFSLPEFALLELPPDCLLRILLALSAPDACRMARVCRLLRQIADSDEVWRPRLPSDPAIDPPSLSRKDLFFRLRARMIHKDFSQPYWLDPETGEGVFVKSARDLSIIWSSTQQYWQWHHQAGSWFAESACLLNVCWLEVTGEFEAMFFPGSYTVSFRLKCQESRGWSRAPLKLSLSTSNGDSVESQFFLYGGNNSEVASPAILRSSPLSSWMELDIGKFVVPKEMFVKLNFAMIEIVGGHWKSGLVLDCAKIQPTPAISRDV